MPETLLTFLKYIFLAVLYLFFLRVLRAVWIELREPKMAEPARAGGPLPSHAAAAPTTAHQVAPAATDGAGRLVVLAPAGQAGRSFGLANEVSVGRSPGCGVALPDDSFVSQVHARLFRRDGGVWVEDLGSTNGTFVNDRQVSAPVELRRGDRLKIGQTVLELGP